MPEVNGLLSNREIAVLRWTADGKTANEISCILNISERTVNRQTECQQHNLGVDQSGAARIFITACQLGLEFSWLANQRLVA